MNTTKSHQAVIHEVWLSDISQRISNDYFTKQNAIFFKSGK